MTVLAWLIFGLASASATESEPEYPEEVRTYMAELDKRLAAHDYRGLAEKIRRPDPIEFTPAALDWAKRKVLGGASLIVTLLYSELLWTVGSGAAPGDPVAVYKESAGLVALYAFAETLADGVKCQDPSAPSHRANVIARAYREPLRTIAQLPSGQQQTYLRAVIDMEVRIGPHRQDDNYLCRFGVQETKDSLEKFGNEGVKETAPPTEKEGHHVEIQTDPAYEPKFLTTDEWEPKQAEVRLKLPELLAELLDKYRDKPASEKDAQPDKAQEPAQAPAPEQEQPQP